MRMQSPFRDLTSGSGIMMLVLVVLLCGILSLSLSYLISVLIWGKSIFSDSSSPETLNLNFLRLTQMMNQVGFFLLPPFIFAGLTKESPNAFLGIAKPKIVHLFAAILLIAVAGPLTGLMVEWNERLILPSQLSDIADWMRSSEVTAARLTNKLLDAPGIPAFTINLVMIGLLPALGEELLFRSALIGVFRSMFKGTHLPVILSAFLFSALHLQFFGFLPRFMLGLAFGYLFVWSGSIWIPVTAHFINNVSVVIASFLYNRGITSIPAEEMGTATSGLWITLSTVAVIVIMSLVYRTKTKEKEPSDNP